MQAYLSKLSATESKAIIKDLKLRSLLPKNYSKLKAPELRTELAKHLTFASDGVLIERADVKRYDPRVKPVRKTKAIKVDSVVTTEVKLPEVEKLMVSDNVKVAEIPKTPRSGPKVKHVVAQIEKLAVQEQPATVQSVGRHAALDRSRSEPRRSRESEAENGTDKPSKIPKKVQKNPVRIDA